MSDLLEKHVQERYDLTIERIKRIQTEETVAQEYRDFFQKTAKFILEIDAVWKRHCLQKEENQILYQDILGEHYENSYANPSYAVMQMGEEIGKLLSFLYTEIRGEIVYVYENKLGYLTICNELFIEIYNCFEQEEVNYRALRDSIYWYVSDYSDVFVTDYIVEMLGKTPTFIKDIIMKSDLSDLQYLYKYGEYISDREWNRAQEQNALSQEEIDGRAKKYVETYLQKMRQENELGQRKIIRIQYPIGYERMTRSFILALEQSGFYVTIPRKPVGIWKNLTSSLVKYQPKIWGGCANLQYEQDHCLDEGIILNKKMVERRLEVIKNSLEQVKDAAGNYVGVLILDFETKKDDFREFTIEMNPSSIRYNEKQEKLLELFESKVYELEEKYINANKYLLREVKNGMVDILKWD